MSAVRSWSELRERAAGKWQIPLLLAALTLLGAAFLRTRPRELRLPVEQLIAEVEALTAGGLHAAAFDQAERLLSLNKLTDDQRGRLLMLSARSRFANAVPRESSDRRTFATVVNAYERAISLGVQPTLEDWRRLGQSRESIGQRVQAIEDFERVIEQSGRPELELRRKVIEGREELLGATETELEPLLGALIERALADADAVGRPDSLYWAFGRLNGHWLDLRHVEDAAGLLERVRGALQDSEFNDELRCDEARVLAATGEADEAERRLRLLRNEAPLSAPVYARAGWLLGGLLLGDNEPNRPQEALSVFRETVELRPGEPYESACRLGIAEALVQLERYDEALDDYAAVIAALEDQRVRSKSERRMAEHAAAGHARAPHRALVAPARVRASLTIAAENLQRRSAEEQALEFAELAMPLVNLDDVELATVYLERMGHLRTAVARELRLRAGGLAPDARAARDGLLEDAGRLLARAADAWRGLSHIRTLDEPASAAAAWRAADLYDEGGDPEQAIAMLEAFVREHRGSPIVPQALLRLGQSRQALGRYAAAIEAYQENQRQFPKTPYAIASLVPMAMCYLAMGREHDDEADQILCSILNDSPVLTPLAPEFADALFLRGDLLSRRGDFERAIPVLEEALQRYPEDRRRTRTQFLLADCYRQSGLAIKQELTAPVAHPASQPVERGERAAAAPSTAPAAGAEYVGEKQQMRAEQIRRLTRAGEVFAELVEGYERLHESALDELQRLLLRHARLYQADCLYETQRYAEALVLYERGAWIYKDTPTALAAYVQIVNCELALGQPEEARAALRRAQYLVRTLPQDRFERDLSPESREDWERYFSWVEGTELF